MTHTFPNSLLTPVSQSLWLEDKCCKRPTGKKTSCRIKKSYSELLTQHVSFSDWKRWKRRVRAKTLKQLKLMLINSANFNWLVWFRITKGRHEVRVFSISRKTKIKNKQTWKKTKPPHTKTSDFSWVGKTLSVSHCLAIFYCTHESSGLFTIALRNPGLCYKQHLLLT